MSVRMGASQEQSKSLEDDDFWVFLANFEKKSENCEAQERPEGTQERPRGAQERPKGAPRASRRVPRGLSRRSGELSGTILTLASSKKERSENDQWGDSLEMPIRRDFSSILEACAQERRCEKPVKTCGLSMFFVSRRLFEQTGQLERKTIENSQKSICLDSPNGPKSPNKL